MDEQLNNSANQSGSCGDDLPCVTIDGEHETSRGWLYTLTVQWADGTRSDHELTLAWVDHEHLVGGSISPSVIARRAALLACRFFGRDEMPARCDVSSLMRLIPGFDGQIKANQGEG